MVKKISLLFGYWISAQIVNSRISHHSALTTKFLHLPEKKTLENVKSQLDGLCLRVGVKQKAGGTRRPVVGGFGKIILTRNPNKSSGLAAGSRQACVGLAAAASPLASCLCISTGYPTSSSPSLLPLSEWPLLPILTSSCILPVVRSNRCPPPTDGPRSSLTVLAETGASQRPSSACLGPPA